MDDKKTMNYFASKKEKTLWYKLVNTVKKGKRFTLYLGRWQMSTLTLTPVMILMKDQNPWLAVVVGNLIGGCIFFFVDRWIFKKDAL
jgi:hypothetical protein